MLSLYPTTWEEKIAESETIYREALAEYKPSKVFALFSGGDDSLTASIFASRQEGFTGVVHINTGIGIKEANRFVRQTCSEQKWPLIELHPTDKTYRDFVLEYGFPGPAAHKYCYVWLKERPLNFFVSNVAKDFKTDRILLITGVRKQESTVRMGRVQKVQRDKCKVWVAPLLYWSKMDCRKYITEAGVRRSPVVEYLHRSGECNCGAYANNDKTNELEEMRMFFPEAAAQIDALQIEATAKGVHDKWGVAPPKVNVPAGEMPLMMLCQSCEAQA